MSVKNQCTS